MKNLKCKIVFEKVDAKHAQVNAMGSHGELVNLLVNGLVDLVRNGVIPIYLMWSLVNVLKDEMIKIIEGEE